MFRVLPNFAHWTVTGNSGGVDIRNYISGISISGSSYITGGVNFSGIGGYAIIKSGNTLLFSGSTSIGEVTNNNTYFVNSGSGIFLSRSYIQEGIDKQYINFPTSLDSNAFILPALHNDYDNSIVPFQISGTETTGFWIIFGDTIPNTGYYLDVLAANLNSSGLATTVIVQNINGGDNSNGINLSGNLYQTGSNLYNHINNVSGNIIQTGITIINKITALSGYSYPWNNPNNYSTSGNLQSTGQNILTILSNYTGYINNNLSGYVTNNTVNLLSGNLQTTGQTLYNLITTLTEDGDQNVKIIKSNKISFKETGIHQLYTIPNNKLFLIDTMEIITDICEIAANAPYIKFGNTNNIGEYWAGSQTTSNSQYSRHILDNPQDAIAAGTTLTFSITTGSTATLHSGYGIIKGYLI